MIVSSTGGNLHIKNWEIEDPKAQIFLVHGYAEHISRYKSLAKKLNKAGFSVVGHDHAGHGKSGGERAYIDRFDQYVWDLKRVIDEYRKEEVPYFIFGHSMGGLVVTSYCTLYRPTDVNGVITSGAALQINDSPILQALAPFLSEIFAHTKTKPIGSQDISRDPEVVADYDNDPKVYREGIKMRLAAEIISRVKKTNSIAKLFTQPVLFMHGSADQLTDPNGTQRFYENCSSEDKELKIWDGLFHELINEPEKDQVIETMIDWINARLPEETLV
jgi:alpha-beta hydrolase superfamily lysophospholipase